MKIILLLMSILFCGSMYGQAYLQQDVGYAIKNNGTKTFLMNLHAGIQLNDAIIYHGTALVEYNQHVLVGGGINPVYLGGRIGYGYNFNESIIAAAWGGQYYRLIASGVKDVNYWVPGYGVSVIWKSLVVDFSKVDDYHVSIGCRFLLD